MASSSSTPPKTVAFIGASTGVGHHALKHTLAAGHHCIALCRTPATLTDALPLASNPNLRVLQGDAHDPTAIATLLRSGSSSGGIVDTVVTTIGARPNLLSLDPMAGTRDLCQKGMATLLAALQQLGSSGGTRPHIITCGTTGVSRFGRDIPLAQVPLYRVLLATPHADKRAMEDALAGSGEAFTLVRCGFLLDGAQRRPVRVGVEDPTTGVEVREIGYAISREDAGRWIAENLVITLDPRYLNKTATLVY